MSNLGGSGRLALLSQLCLDYNQIVADVKNADRKRRVFQNRELGLSFFSSDDSMNRENRAIIERQIFARIGNESLLRYRAFNDFGCLKFLGDLSRRTSQDDSTPRMNSGFVAYDTVLKQVVVVLLGSLKKSDYWLYNGNLRRKSALSVWSERLSTLPVGLQGLELHRGYATLALELSHQVDDILANTSGSHENMIRSYLYTGHSLGAAAAGQMQILKELECFQDGVSCTTYGLLFAQPRSIVIVDEQGKENNILETTFMGSLSARTLDFVVANDVVPIASGMWPAAFIGEDSQQFQELRASPRKRGWAGYESGRCRSSMRCEGAASCFSLVEALIRDISTTVGNFRRQCGKSAFGAVGTRWEAGVQDGSMSIPSGSRHFAKVYMKEVTKAVTFQDGEDDMNDAAEKDWTEAKRAKHIDGRETLTWWIHKGMRESGEEAECAIGNDMARIPFSCDDDVSLNEDCVAVAPRS
jgi:hypothetical protein